MKKIASILAMAIAMFIASAALGSCSKHNDSESLDGTTWTATETTHGSTYSYTLSFGKSTFSMQFTAPTDSEGGKETETYAGTYSYDHPVVIMTANMDGKDITFNGIREGNILKLTSSLGPLTFTKK